MDINSGMKLVRRFAVVGIFAAIGLGLCLWLLGATDAPHPIALVIVVLYMSGIPGWYVVDQSIDVFRITENSGSPERHPITLALLGLVAPMWAFISAAVLILYTFYTAITWINKKIGTI